MSIFTYTDKNLRVQILSERIVRIEEAFDGEFTDKPTLLVPNRREFLGTVAKTVQNGDATCIKTEFFTVCIKGDSASNVEIYAGEKCIFDATTPHNDFYASLPSPAETKDVFVIDDCGILPAEGGLTYVGNDAENSGWDRKEHTDFYVLIPLADSCQLRSDFVALTGRTALSNIKTLGSWWSKWSRYSDEDRYKIIARYRENGIPFDIMVIDTEWKNTSQNGNDGDGTGYNVNTDLFPDMKGFLTKANELGLHILFNDHTHKTDMTITTPEELKWQSAGIRSLMEIGLNGWWYDRNWSFSVKTPYKDVRFSTIGQVLYYDTMRAFYKDNAKNGAPKRVLMLSNVDWIKHGHVTNDPSLIGHRYGVQWTGDIYGHSLQLKREIENMVLGGVKGASPYMSSDLGGFWHNDNISENHYLRWVQYGSFSPTFRIHSTLGCVNDHFPWSYGDAAEKVAKEFLCMRYHLMPYYYAAARENYDSGMPLMRRLDFYYPEYKEAADNSQYLLGKDVLVAPFWSTTGDGYEAVPSEWLSTDGKQGIRAQYWNYAEGCPREKIFNGTPACDLIEPNVENYWLVGSPNAIINKDFFSARYTGKITPEYDCYVGVIADDGARLFINGEKWVEDFEPSEARTTINREKCLKKGETYDIVMEYYEIKGKAVAYLVCEPVLDEGMSVRNVFIPSGAWYNVFSGERVVGPKSISVKGSTAVMPIFVREGAALPVAPVISPMTGGNWQELSINLYGLSETSFTLYEDDGESEAYLDGKFRKTEVCVCKDGENWRIDIGAANGDFDSDCETRIVKLRIHSNRAVKGARKIEKDASARPFANEGASRILDVYEITVAASVKEGASYTVCFE